jgi:hypothetical protein
MRDPNVLEQQVRRMLRDERASELMRNFGGQWPSSQRAGTRPRPDNFLN